MIQEPTIVIMPIDANVLQLNTTKKHCLAIAICICIVQQQIFHASFLKMAKMQIAHLLL